MITKSITYLSFLCCLLVGAISCTNNPFFGGDDFPANRLTITGNVTLEGVSDHSGVFIWLEGVSAFTRSDSLGEFTLELPSPERLPGGASAYTGNFTLYYYMANFRFDSVGILLRNGEVEFGQKSVDSNGRITSEILLRRLLTISTSVTPNVIQAGVFPQNIQITIDVVPTIYGANIKTYTTDRNTLGAFLFARRDSLNLSHIHILPTSKPVSEFINYPISGTDAVNVSLPVGTYEIVPFLQIEQSGLPDALIESISEFAYTLTHQYLYVPLRIESEKLNVIN